MTDNVTCGADYGKDDDGHNVDTRNIPGTTKSALAFPPDGKISWPPKVDQPALCQCGERDKIK